MMELETLQPGYEHFLDGMKPSTEYGEPSSDDLSSEWDTDDGYKKEEKKVKVCTKLTVIFSC